ncbi:MAG: hypothetical protein DRQ55_17265 [Planctomycetota bacterium]|nr:MAG: hypothetical protein DRQ55_17265 [Planctomycetota bacterium]
MLPDTWREAVLSKYSADSDQRVLASCGDEFGMPGCHAAAEIDGRVVANALMTVDAHTLGASFWSLPAVVGPHGRRNIVTPRDGSS